MARIIGSENRAQRTKALAYLRTSSASNVGGDSDKRQREAIHGFAQAHGFELAGEFYDAAVSGSDLLEARPGFAAMLDRIEGNGVRVVIVEDASRFARSVMTQELGVLAMQQRGVVVLTAGGDDLTNTDDPAKVMMRQIAGAFAQYEKARLVQKLRAARNRKSEATGKRIEGRKGYAETSPELVKAAKRLYRRSPKTGERRSLRGVAAELAEAGFRTAKGLPFSAAQVKRLVD